MTLKYILQELYQWFTYRMEDKKARRKFMVVIVMGVLVLIAVYAANGSITQKQSGSIHGPSTSQPVSTSNTQTASNTQTTSNQDQDQGPGPGSTDTQQPTLLLSAIIISSVMGVSIVSSTGMQLHYRKKHMDCIAALPVLYSEETMQ